MSRDLDAALERKRSGDLDGALIALESFLAGNPSHSPALAHLADVQVRRGRRAEAADALDRAEAVAGTTAFTARVRGDLLAGQERWEEAARSYADAVALGEKGWWAPVRLASCRLSAGDVEGAKGAALRAVEAHPAASGGWIVLGDVATREGDLDGAEAMYQRAHDEAPGDQWAYAKLVEARLAKLPPDRREREVKVLLKTAGRDNRYLLGVLARLRREAGDDEAAAEVWGEAARTGAPSARRQHGYALRRAGKLDEAAAVLGACLVEQPDDVILFKTYVGLQQKRGDHAGLRSTLEAALPRAGAGRKGAFHAALKKIPEGRK
ncbi:MAG TPA: tetratricopeptide repeat protein [Acidimicrobiales bacterium]|nr:tetratricopeptide repeat protein [Acidimicrobiales bacterium]